VTVLPREPLKAAFRAVHAEEPTLRGLGLEYLSGVLPEGVRGRLWEILDAGERQSPRGTEASPSALEELLRSQDGLLAQLAKGITPSAGDAPAQSGRRPPATRSSAPR
jgi:hypothetical protein